MGGYQLIKQFLVLCEQEKKIVICFIFLEVISERFKEIYFVLFAFLSLREENMNSSLIPCFYAD